MADITGSFISGTTTYKSKYTVANQTTSLQQKTETECAPFFISIASLDPNSKKDLERLGLIKDEKSTNIRLLRKKHAAYLKRPLYKKDVQTLPGSYISLDSSKPWIIYWTLHGLDLLDDLPDEDTLIGIVNTLEACWSNVNHHCNNDDDDNDALGGGFGGGVGQLPHCATSYAAVNALSIIAGCDGQGYSTAAKLALDLLKRKRDSLLKWFLSLRYERAGDNEKGSMVCGYRMQHDGEVDVRATYCICSVSSLLNILTSDLMDGMMEHVVECQTFEGGFGGEPFAEAHGGYTFCALGALQILTKAKGMVHLEQSGVDFVALRDWLVNRQMGYEGGFQGRCNKLVDGCYTFWVGSAIAILGLDGTDQQFDSGVYGIDIDIDTDNQIQRTYDEASNDILDSENGGLLFDQKILQRYVLLCAQDINGGLRDKPSKPRDFYHSCYNLSGLSVSQHVLSSKPIGDGSTCEALMYEAEEGNVLGKTHPVYNIRIERAIKVIRTFEK
jgi:protein farnesyltransferase subunit beta